MKTKLINTKKETSENIVEQVNNVLKNKGIVVLPTDTVYGIMTSVFNFDGQKNIRTEKQKQEKTTYFNGRQS